MFLCEETSWNSYIYFPFPCYCRPNKTSISIYRRCKVRFIPTSARLCRYRRIRCACCFFSPEIIRRAARFRFRNRNLHVSSTNDISYGPIYSSVWRTRLAIPRVTFAGKPRKFILVKLYGLNSFAARPC